MQKIKSARFLFILSGLFFYFGCSSGKHCTQSSKCGSEEVIPFIGSSVLKRYEFKNGLKLVVLEDKTSPTFAYQTWFRVGSKDEIEKYTGLAHLFEHMMFKGTKRYPGEQFDKILQENGVEGENAMTNNDYTGYVQELPKEKLSLIMELESDRMVNLIVDEQSFATEREVVHNERRFTYENSSNGLMYQEIAALSFEKSPYRWPTIGYEEDLNRMHGTDAAAFYKKYYAPNNATVVVVGDVSFDDMKSKVEKFYGHLKPSPIIRREHAEETPQKKEKLKRLKIKSQVDKLWISYHIPSILHEDVPALIMLQSVLSKGNFSRLSRSMIDGGWLTHVDTTGMDELHPSIFIVMANVASGKNPLDAERVFLREISKLQNHPVSFDELEKSRNVYYANFYSDLTTPMEVARFIGLFETISPGVEFGIEMKERIKNVTPAKIQEVAKRYFQPNQRNTLIGEKR